MRKYDHKKIEKKWQREWQKKEIYRSKENPRKPKSYVLDMFPYPSGEGLHVGHPKGYIATDVYARHKRMTGHSVLHPMGWDAFGLPAENFAIQNKVHPRAAVAKNIARFKEQLSTIGLDYDWSREINTTDPSYYKWTQWIFLKLLEKGLAYESNEPINWCPKCQTGLSNEDLDGNACERCGTIVEKRPMRQWMLRITDYAERLLNDLSHLPEWQEHIKESQRNWIGRSEGAEIDFPLEFENTTAPKPNYLLLHGYKESPIGAFIPWLNGELERRGLKVQVPELPNSWNPKETEQVKKVLDTCTIDERTIIVGHSLGGAIALKVLEKINRPIAGLMLVASAVNAKFPGAVERPYQKHFNWDVDYARIRKLAGFSVILSDLQEGTRRIPYLKFLAKELGARLVEGNAEEKHFMGKEEPMVLNALLPSITVFTTRADTLFGATYMVLAPEHPWVRLAIQQKGLLKNEDEIVRYIALSDKKTELERITEQKKKTGVRLEGVEAVNPATGKKIPIFIADYVLAHYGTGAIMAVPAHDERDFEFAKKFKLPIVEVIEPLAVRTTGLDAVHADGPFHDRPAILAFVKHWSEDKYLAVRYKPTDTRGCVSGGIDEGEEPIATAQREIREETGYVHTSLVRKLGGTIHGKYYSVVRKWNTFAHYTPFLFTLDDDTCEQVSEKEKADHEITWLTKKEMDEFINHEDMRIAWVRINGRACYEGEGILANSGEFSGMESAEARKAITGKLGRAKVTYKLRDWVFSRQRYWGEPIPVIHCAKCGVVPVPEKDLPVKLPEVNSYQPTGTGHSPLASIAKWVNVRCPKCKGPGTRETNTMPQWAGSSWYHLRYMDPKNKKALVDKKKEKYWAPVDTYVGGAEHATRHLIYARFWHKFLHDIGVVSTPEPFMRLISVGLIQAPDGKKMSKRYGNVINPDDIVKAYGADTLRMYEMFMGPFTDSIAWSTESMIGARRFLERVWRLGQRANPSTTSSLRSDGYGAGNEERGAEGTERQLHKTILKVGSDIESFKFNTAIAAMMTFTNVAEKEGINKDQFVRFLKILAPFAPHMTEELWSSFAKATKDKRGARKMRSIHTEKWPSYDVSKLKDETVRIAVQINGKTRGEASVAADADKEAQEAAARGAVAARLDGKQVVRTIVVPGRLMNLIVSD